MSALAIVLATAIGAQGATATWDRSPETGVAGYKLSYGTQPGVHTVTIDVGNVTTHTFYPPPGYRYYVAVRAYNTAGVLSAMSGEVVLDVPAANRAPTMIQPANQTSLLNASVLMALSASDPDGNSMAFNANGLPPGVSINAASGIISGIALAKGTYQVSVTVSDGALAATRTFSWTILDNASAPIVVDVRPLDTTLFYHHYNYSANPSLYVYTLPATRVTAAVLMKFNLSQIPSNATVTSATLNLWMTMTDGYVAVPNYTMSLHQVMGRNPDIARATGWMADGVTQWTASQCCMGGAPIAQADISAARSWTTVNRTLGPKVFDATSLARAWLAAPATNYGLLLNPDTSRATDGYRVFASMEEAVAARRPFLRVTYTVPVSPPSPGALSSLATAGAPEDSYARVAGDFDGDGLADLSTYRTGEWRIWTSRSAFANLTLINWGGIGDVPVAADYDGDKITDVGIYQPLSGRWEIRLSKTQQPLVLTWGGVTGDQASAFDADGDGKADLVIMRGGLYRILLSSTNYSTNVIAR